MPLLPVPVRFLSVILNISVDSCSRSVRFREDDTENRRGLLLRLRPSVPGVNGLLDRRRISRVRSAGDDSRLTQQLTD